MNWKVSVSGKELHCRKWVWRALMTDEGETQKCQYLSVRSFPMLTGMGGGSPNPLKEKQVDQGGSPLLYCQPSHSFPRLPVPGVLSPGWLHVPTSAWLASGLATCSLGCTSDWQPKCGLYRSASSPPISAPSQKNHAPHLSSQGNSWLLITPAPSAGFQVPHSLPFLHSLSSMPALPFPHFLFFF